MKKTFKIGECAIGGILQVEKKKDKYIARALDYNTKEVIQEMTCDNLQDLEDVLCEWSTSYWADTIINKL